MSRPARRILLVCCLWSLVSGLWSISSAWACPGCKEALIDPGQAQAVSRAAQGYAASIALMLGMPVAVIGGLGVWLLRSARRKRASRSCAMD